MRKPVLVFSQGDPAGIGPELLLRIAAEPETLELCSPILVLESAALDSVAGSLELDRSRFRWLDPDFAAYEPLQPGEVGLVDPSGEPRPAVVPGRPSAADARGAIDALDAAVEWVRSGPGDALVTAPINKAEIARHLDPDFRGHTDYLAEKAGSTRYGRDYMMAFLSADLRVALLSTHISLREALDAVTEERIVEALRLMARHVEGPIAVAGIDPHAGEGGLIGNDDARIVAPAVRRARAEGIDAHGPESADSLFVRARRGQFAWVLALYHDQGLIAIKTAAFGDSTNWTLGLPFVRTSVDHGTAYDIAGQGRADPASLRAVVRETVRLVAKPVV